VPYGGEKIGNVLLFMGYYIYADKDGLKPHYQFGETKLMITAEQMKTLPELFNDIEDPRRTQGRRHRLSSILGIATGAVLCGRVGYKGIVDG
jgi:hypothetical protein